MGSGDVRARGHARHGRAKAFRIQRTREWWSRKGAAGVSARPHAEWWRDRRRARVLEIAALQRPPADGALLLPRAPESQGPASLPRRLQLIEEAQLTREDFPPRVSEVEPCRSEEHTSELQSRLHLVCRLLLEKKKNA